MQRPYSFWKNLPTELGFGDWHDFFANGITAIILGIIIGALFGWQVERIGIFWGCVAGIALFSTIGFRKQIWYFIRFLFRVRSKLVI